MEKRNHFTKEFFVYLASNIIWPDNQDNTETIDLVERKRDLFVSKMIDLVPHLTQYERYFSDTVMNTIKEVESEVH